ncbi:MAG: hypothetical protein ABIP74_05205 [Candidatus Saccharimonas sp.]
MRKSITQESDYGCGVACFAFATNQTYQQAATWLGKEQASSDRFWCKDLAAALNRCGLNYISKYARPHVIEKTKVEGAIVLLKRSKDYPVGHYLIRHNGLWMDPWINLPENNHIARAESGFRDKLPGEPMYFVYPRQ